jgi:ABC-type transporter Mla subunit MlaD
MDPDASNNRRRPSSKSGFQPRQSRPERMKMAESTQTGTSNDRSEVIVSWLEAMAPQVDAMARKLEAILTKLEAMAPQVNAMAPQLEAIAPQVNAMARRLGAIPEQEDAPLKDLNLGHSLRR